jgi:tripartite-type tricarboxylate transporter receptor subunit TctC
MKKAFFHCGFISLVLFGVFVFSLSSAFSQDYPTRPIQIMVPFAPGGMSDLPARAFAATAEKYLGQPMVVINKPGGKGLTGALDVAKGKPDGYMIGFFQLHLSIPEAYAAFQQPPYTSNDLKPIAQLVNAAPTIAVKADAPWNTLAELIEYARKNPTLKYGSQPEGTLASLTMKSISKKSGVPLQAVPIESDSAILTSLLGGHVPVGTINFPTVKPHLEAGKVKLLAVMLDERLASAPKVPTIAECGYRLIFVPFVGFFAPQGTPDAIIKKLETTIKKVTEDPAFLEKIQKLSIQAKYRGSEQLTTDLSNYKKNIESAFKELGYTK